MPWTRHVFLSCQDDMFVHQTRMNLPRSPDRIHVDVYACGYFSLFLSLSLSLPLVLYCSTSSTCLVENAFSGSEVFALVGRTNGRSICRSRLFQTREETPSPLLSPIEHKDPDGRDTRLALSA